MLRWNDRKASGYIPYIVTFRHPDDRIVASFYNFLFQVKVAESERPDDP